jgi:LuxR family transcriptional regulator, quorum-sensing system regulator BjaR1
MPHTLTAFADAVSAILAAANPKTCSAAFRKALATFEISTFASGEVDLAHLERTVFYAIGWPESFRKFYVSSGLFRRDPLVDALRRRHLPFTWSELRRDRRLSLLGGEALQKCADEGWTEGLAVPIPRGDRRFGLVSLACQRRSFSAEEKSLLTMLSLCFHERMRNFAPKHGFALPPVGLSKREIECLRLIARGATDRDVGRKLGISSSTAHEYIEKAKKKLKVSTRTEAIAIAVSLAIVTPDGSGARIATVRPAPMWEEEERTFGSRRQVSLPRDGELGKIEVGFLVPLVFAMNVIVAIVAWYVV